MSQLFPTSLEAASNRFVSTDRVLSDVSRPRLLIHFLAAFTSVMAGKLFAFEQHCWRNHTQPFVLNRLKVSGIRFVQTSWYGLSTRLIACRFQRVSIARASAIFFLALLSHETEVFKKKLYTIIPRKKRTL